VARRKRAERFYACGALVRPRAARSTRTLGIRGKRHSHLHRADSGCSHGTAANRRGPDYQVTLIESENIAAFSEMVDVPFTPDVPRRNIVTQGIRLNKLCGKTFKVGGATLEGLELCEPCSLFAKRTHRDVLKYFPRKGGLRARIVADA